MREAGAWLALWNGFDSARDAEYNDWHAREHVPERLTVPGMLRASRYRAVDDAVLPYFTLYEMDSIDVLASPGYLALLDRPTPWTRRMRPLFGELLRIPCRVAAPAGAVRAAALMSLELRAAQVLVLPLAMGQLRATPGVARVHAGREDPAVAPLPWHGAATAAAASAAAASAAAASAAAAPATQLLLVEAQSLDDLRALAGALPAGLAALEPVVRLHRLLSLHDAPH